MTRRIFREKIEDLDYSHITVTSRQLKVMKYKERERIKVGTRKDKYGWYHKKCKGMK